MDEILIACGDVELLRKIASDLPNGRFKPIATKSGEGIAKKIAKRNVRIAVVHEHLGDGPGPALCQQLQQLPSPPAILYLSSGSPPSDGPFDLTLKYPVVGPVLRNAIQRLAPSAEEQHDLERWRDFYNELKTRVASLGEQDYYQMLGVDASAPHHAIVSVYDRLSMRYHPDRYNQFRNERWGEAIYDLTNTLFKELTDAFAVLTDRRLKKKYDHALTTGRNRLSPEEKNAQDTGPELLENLAQSAQGKKFLRLAQRDMARSDWTAALQNLKFAASMEPDIPAIAEKISEVEQKLAE